MSLYPILWAAEHAPVQDAEERAILCALVLKGDFDGRNCHRSYKTLGEIARCDRKTAERKCHAMEARGILRRQKGPKPQSWHRLPADKKTVVWEVMIPADFWSATQLGEINTARAERGLPPITRDSNPPLGPPPPKKTRADKGKKAPQRRPKSLPPKNGETAGHVRDETPERPGPGDSQSPRSDTSGGTHSPLAGGLTVPSRGDSQSPNPPIDPPNKTSSSSSSPLADARQSQPSHPKEEEEAATPKSETQERDDDRETPDLLMCQSGTTVPQPRPGDDGEHQAAAGLVSSLPGTLTRGNRNRLVSLTAAALTAGWTAGQLRAELMRDLGSAASRVGVWVTRLRELGDPPAAAPARAALPPRCDHPDHDQYGTDRLLYPANGPARPCPTCHPMYLGDAR